MNPGFMEPLRGTPGVEESFDSQHPGSRLHRLQNSAEFQELHSRKGERRKRRGRRRGRGGRSVGGSRGRGRETEEQEEEPRFIR